MADTDNKGFSVQDYAASYARTGSFRTTAKEFGVNESTVRRSINHLKKSDAKKEALGPEIAARISSGYGITDFSAVHSGWMSNKDENGNGDNLYFYVGKDDDAVSLDTMVDMIEESFADLTPAPPMTPPEDVMDDLVTVYPIADAHLGMLAWAMETGEDYDSRIASERIQSWIGRAVSSSPASKEAIIIDVGDLTHADDQKNMTPGSGHILDVDTRHFRTLDITIKTLVTCVETALARHEKVTVSVLKGNHDPNSYLTVLFSIAAWFRNEPRVDVLKQPGDFFVREFGKVLISANHGDKASAQRLVMFLADRYAEMWGRTVFRYLFTGHNHHLKSADIGGMTWEQLNGVTAQDYYTFSHAFSGRAQLSGITYHKDEGVRSRVYVNA